MEAQRRTFNAFSSAVSVTASHSITTAGHLNVQIIYIMLIEEINSPVKHSFRETGSHSAVSGLQVLLAIPLGTIGPSSQGRDWFDPTSVSGQE